MTDAIIKSIVGLSAGLLRQAADALDESDIGDRAIEFLTKLRPDEQTAPPAGEVRAVCPLCGVGFEVPLPEWGGQVVGVYSSDQLRVREGLPIRGWVCQACARVLGWDGCTHTVSKTYRVAGTTPPRKD